MPPTRILRYKGTFSIVINKEYVGWYFRTVNIPFTNNFSPNCSNIHWQFFPKLVITMVV